MCLKIPKVILVFAVTVLLSGCSTPHTLPDTPNLYTAPASTYPSEDVAPSYQTSSPDIFYITDRFRSPDIAETTYISERSASMAFGKVNVCFGDEMSWEELVHISAVKSRDDEIPLTLSDIDEITRFPQTPLPFEIIDGKYATRDDVAKAYAASTEAMQKNISEKLNASKAKDIILFIHGFNNSFEDSALNLADIWHFTGRHGVPVFYSWPAAHGGVKGYFVDSESGEFSIYHLKETIRILSEMPELERLHIIAHSRGTALVSSAIRELVIEVRASGADPREVLKMENVILAAPDLDVGVVQQRLGAERLETAIGQTTIYTNREDRALGISQFLVDGLRFGRLSANDLSEQEREIMGQIRNVSFINVEGVDSLIGHSYYRKHSGVLSDLAILIRQGLKPGEPGRPLIRTQDNFWVLPIGYPHNENLEN